MKRLFCSILCCFLISNVVFANEEYVLNLEQAKNLAKTNNPQIEVLEVNKKSAQISLTAAKYSKASSVNAEVMFGDTQTPLVKKGYYVEAANSNIFLLDLQSKQVNSKIEYDVTEKYYSYILSNKLVEIATSAENLANENYNTVKKYYDLGMVAQLDVKNAEANLLNASSVKNSYIRNAELAKENFKITMNIDSDSEFVLTDGIVVTDYTSDVEEDLKSALVNRYDVNALKESARLSKLNFDIVGIYNLGNTANYNKAKSDYIQTEYSCKNNTRLIGLGIRSTYNNILNNKEKLELAEKDFEIKCLEYEVAKLKYEVGTITNSQLMMAQNSMSSSQVQLENAKLNYLLSVEKYKYEISIGL